MAFIATPNTARCALEFSYTGQQCVITLWFEAETSFDVTSLIALADALISWATTNLMPTAASALSLIGVRATAQDSSSAPSIFRPVAAPVVGGQTGNAQAPQVAAVASLRTDLRGRSYRGRNYVPGIADSQTVNAGELSVTGAASLAAAYEALADVETATGTTHVVVSHYTGGAARGAGVTTPVTEYVVDQPLDTQRRRAFGRGA